MRRGSQGPFSRQRSQRHHVQAVVEDSSPLARRCARHFEDGAVGGVVGRNDRRCGYLVVLGGLNNGRARLRLVFLDARQRVLDDLYGRRVHNHDRAVPALNLKAHANAVVVVVDDDPARAADAAWKARSGAAASRARSRAKEAAAPLVESFLASLAGAACAPAASSARARVVVATRREEAAREGRAAAAPAAQPAATGFARAVDVALEQLDALIAAKHGAAPPAKRTKRLFGDATNVVLGF